MKPLPASCFFFQVGRFLLKFTHDTWHVGHGPGGCVNTGSFKLLQWAPKKCSRRNTCLVRKFDFETKMDAKRTYYTQELLCNTADTLTSSVKPFVACICSITSI